MKTLSTRIFVLLAVAFASAAFVACSDDDATPPRLTPETGEFGFTSGSYTKTLAVETEHLASFSAEVIYAGAETGWVTPRVVAGGVQVTVQPNTASSPRSAKLVLSAPGVQPVEVAISQKAKFASELIGSYSPRFDQASYDFGLFIASEWNEQGAPKLMLGTTEIEWALIEMMLPQLAGIYYVQGLAGLDLLDDGRLAARYHTVTLENGMTDIFSPTFGTETLVFPDPVMYPAIPVDLIKYYTQGDKIFLSVDKPFISRVDPGTLGAPIVSVIEGLIAKYRLALVSNEEVFALPLKYKVEQDVLTLYVDREMILPFKQLLLDVIGSAVPDAGISMSEEMTIAKADILQFVTGLFDNSTKLEIGIKLTRQAE
ncbi:BACON domain-containing protein [Alistipes sp.]|uniref:BACON domain-containing protein n=1 Tax=Alistipes sp. TaxID=1872444 RepID=UPI003AF1D0E4